MKQNSCVHSGIQPIKWHSQNIKISELKEYEHNPRRIGKKEFEKLVSSIKEDGYHQRILVNQDNTIIGGHQRKKALLEAGLKENDTVEVLAPDRNLTQDELYQLQ